MILPGYDGYSIANIPASICRWLGEEQWPTYPLAPEIHELFNRQYRQVILVVMDGMGWNTIQRFGGETPLWQEVLDSGVLLPLTSIAPATTSSALTSFWTGRTPAQHGVTGYEMWLRDYNLSANMITHTPAMFEGMPGSLRYCGFNPEAFLQVETLGPFFAKAGIQTSVLQSNNILGSGLSTMLFGETRQVPVRSLHDLFITLGHMANEKITDKRYLYVYWGNLDELQHIYGLDDGRVEQEYRVFQSAFTRFIRNLQKSANKDTLVLLTADHGMTLTKPSPEYEIRRYPELVKKLHLLPAGESRLPYLYVKPGHIQAVKDEVRQIWKDDFMAIDASEAIESGLFGSPPFHPELDSRLGDLILISRGSSYLYWQIKENRLLGRHGGLSKEEMIVPLFMFES
jgi:predicted AlkP superfamily pyrophosphatase or phosphodiesterase